MNTKTGRALIASAIIATLALGGVVAGTFALFSRQVSTTAHIKVGNLNFSFARTKLVSNSLDAQGTISETVDNTVVDLSNDGADALDVDGAVPGASYELTFKLSNTGATAFSTVVSIPELSVKDDQDNNAPSDSSIYAATTVTFEATGATAVSYTLDQNRSDFQLPKLIKDGEQEFTMKVEIGDNAGNDAQGLTINMGIQLVATQVTE
ncbi:MAG: hypothetical protein J5511_01310 [Bacilli bacterium]|nr:hypothetical protein [Bacilli bacterium]